MSKLRLDNDTLSALFNSNRALSSDGTKWTAWTWSCSLCGWSWASPDMNYGITQQERTVLTAHARSAEHESNVTLKELAHEGDTNV